MTSSVWSDNKQLGKVGDVADKIHLRMIENKHSNGVATFLAPGMITSLFGCCSSLAGCCFSCFCPCMVAAANEGNINERSVTPVDFLFCCPSPYSTRQTLRKKYNLPQSPWQDCLALTCCGCCFINQTTREIAHRTGKPPQYFRMD